jgi:hypothetical protein
MQTNVVLLPSSTPFSSRIAIEVHYLPFEWRNITKGELQCVQLDTLLNINPKHWNFITQRPTKLFSKKNNHFHHFMIEVQIKRATEGFKELKSMMIEGQMCGNAIEALYMERNRLRLMSSWDNVNWRLYLN